MDAVKQRGLRKCAMCGLGVMHCGLPIFFRLKIQRYGIDMRAVQAQHGLEQMIGNAVIASVLGTDADLAKPINDEQDLFICETCSQKPVMLVELALREDSDDSSSD